MIEQNFWTSTFACSGRPATQTEVVSWYLTFKPYRKPGNAHAYIPFTSFHARHTFRGWVLAELLRFLPTAVP
jgi:hypothetical protein